jgi:hypothetical protein
MPIKRNLPKPNAGGNLQVKKSSYETFGILMINIRFLDDNLLLAKHSASYGPVRNLRRTKISDDMVNILKDLLISSQINYNLLSELENEEIDLFDRLITKAKLKSLLQYKRSKIKLSPQKLKAKYNILKGQIIAGNDNKEIISDIESLLPDLVKSNVINEEKAMTIKYLINHLNE